MIGDLAMQLLQAVVAVQLASAPLPAERTREVSCLAQNIWFEARGSSPADQRAVAHVVLNRVESRHYPDDICEVVWQPKQFSWTHDGRSDRVRFGNGRDRAVWKGIVETAMAATAGTSVDPTGGATHYHAVYVRPAWSSRMRALTRIDDHIYYRPHGRRIAARS